MTQTEDGGATVSEAEPTSGGDGAISPNGADAVEEAVQEALDARDISDPALMPLMTGASIDELKTYQSLFILDTIGDPPADLSALTGTVDPFAQPAEGHDLPAVGVLTTHQQSWTQRGLAFGNLLHSVCLAPGEVTQVAVVDWQRKTAGTSSESTDQSEDVASAADQTRAVNEVQNAVAREAQSGGSASAAMSATAQAGGSMGGLFMAASASTSMSATSAMTAQFSVGSRDLAASSTNALSQRTAERSQALRSRRAAVVKEVSQREAENLSARVLANYNRRHALNIEYFEVLQLYAIETRLASWDRCLFVPMPLIDFTNPDVVHQHKASLTRFFIESGRAELVDQLLFDDESSAATRIDQEIALLDAQIERDLARVQDANEKYAALEGAYSAALELDKARDDLARHRGTAAEAVASNMVVSAVVLYTQRIGSNAKHWLPDVSQSGLAPTIAKAMQECRSIDQELTGDDKTSRTSGTIWQARKDRDALIARRAALRLTTAERLMAEQLALSQAIWIRMDPFRIYRILAKYTLDGEPLAALVEPYPVGVFGTYLAFRWGFDRTETGESKRKDFEAKYIAAGDAGAAVTSNIAVPTSGVFAEAILGRGEAAETIDDTRLWDWQAFPIPILPSGLASFARDRAKDLPLESHDLDPSLAQLRATDPADASHLGGMLAALGNGSMFRDMGGLAQAVTLADKVAAITGSGAQDAAARAAEIHGKILDTFVDVLNSDVGKAAVAEFMLPGAGAAVLGAGGGGQSRDKEAE